MSDKKFTDEEIIKALECCISATTDGACVGCPFNKQKLCDKDQWALERYALDLINRQKTEIEALKMEFSEMRDKANSYKAENERLKVENMFAIAERNAFDTSFNKVLKQFKNAKAEAYKEFAEKLKQHKRKMRGFDLNEEFWDYAVLVEDIDDFLKEMVNEEK